MSTEDDKSETPARKAEALKARNAKKRKARQSLISNILGRETGDINEVYTFGREIRKIPLGSFVEIEDKRTKEQFDCKVIAKRKLLLREDIDVVRREVAIMHHLAGMLVKKTFILSLSSDFPRDSFLINDFL